LKHLGQVISGDRVGVTLGVLERQQALANAGQRTLLEFAVPVEVEDVYWVVLVA
jgi:hypothetical protein